MSELLPKSAETIKRIQEQLQKDLHEAFKDMPSIGINEKSFIDIQIDGNVLRVTPDNINHLTLRHGILVDLQKS